VSPFIVGIASLLVFVFTGGIGWYLRRFTAITEMLGMMIGMTFGMMTGITIGYLVGTVTDMFISNLVGVLIGVAFGVVCGRVGGLMGMMDGGMGGMMGGMMGAMLGVMLQYDVTAILVTTVLMLVLDGAAMLALVLLVRKSAAMKLAVDPVCKMQVDPERAISFDYLEKTYYFCARECQEAFAKEPTKYVGALR
jgi:YHS domain-containing protein